MVVKGDGRSFVGGGGSGWGLLYSKVSPIAPASDLIAVKELN